MAEKSFQIRNYSFDQKAINNLAVEDHLEENWPVVYQIYNNQQIYIGETTNLKNRMNQHLANVEKSSLRHGSVKVVFDETFIFVVCNFFIKRIYSAFIKSAYA